MCAQIVIEDTIFAQTLAVDSLNDKDNSWKLSVKCNMCVNMLIGCKIKSLIRPSNIWNFYIAILREKPENVTRLLGTVDMARGEILQKAQDGQLQVVGMLTNLLCISAANCL